MWSQTVFPFSPETPAIPRERVTALGGRRRVPPVTPNVLLKDAFLKKQNPCVLFVNLFGRLESPITTQNLVCARIYMHMSLYRYRDIYVYDPVARDVSQKQIPTGQYWVVGGPVLLSKLCWIDTRKYYNEKVALSAGHRQPEVTENKYGSAMTLAYAPICIMRGSPTEKWHTNKTLSMQLLADIRPFLFCNLSICKFFLPFIHTFQTAFLFCNRWKVYNTDDSKFLLPHCVFKKEIQCKFL